MENKNNACDKFRIKRCINSVIDVLIAQEVMPSELCAEAKNVIQSILPEADDFLKTIVTNYAQTKQRLYIYENILDDSLDKYMQEASHDDRVKN